MRESSSRLDKLPFRHPLVDSPLSVSSTGHPKFWSFADSPDYVIRESPIFKREYIKTEIEQISKFKTALNKLEGYGLRYPGLASVLGQEIEDGEPTNYIVTRLVRGDKITTPFPEEVGRKLFETIAQYYSDIANNGGLYLDDLHLNNFVYGRTKDDTEDHIYYVDLEIGVRDYDKKKDGAPNIFQGYCTILDQGVIQLEHFYGHAFPEYREKANKVKSAFGGK